MSSDVRDRDLHALLVGALDPEVEARIRAAVDRSAALKTRLQAIAGAQLEVPDEPSPWRIPPPAVTAALPGPLLAATLPPALDGGPLRRGARVRLRLQCNPSFSDHIAVVLLRPADTTRWQVVAPEAPSRARSLAELPSHPDGGRAIDVLVHDASGAQRWAVVLAPAGLAPAWDGPVEARWEALQAAVARGEVPARSVEVEVVG